MLKEKLGEALKAVLSPYIEGFDAMVKDHLSIGLWEGRLSLDHVSFKPSALDDLTMHLPLSVVRATIGSIEVSVPWLSLLTASVRVTVRDVCLLMRMDYSRSPVRSNTAFMSSNSLSFLCVV
jgi:hypothetical protein